VPPRALRPVGVALVDKPAGPSSFAIVATLRRRTRARTGHAGTLDPFATGLLVLLSGSATRLAPCFVGLDKRYLTTVDLTSTTTTGDPEGEIVERHAAPLRTGIEEGLERLRGEVRLPIPAASAVKIGGERAYKLARRGVVVEMPLRNSLVHALDVITYSGEGETVESVELALHVSSGTYVRSIAEALGGHCTSLRRTAIGPFELEEATSVEEAALIPAAAALARLDEGALERVPLEVRAGVLALEGTQGTPAGGSAA
jgi:tRNA pseudouridine55 synthase